MKFLYRHFDGTGRLLYVGASLNPIHRLMEHEWNSPWFREIRTVTITPFRSPREAEIEEIRAIREEKPLYNIKSSTINCDPISPREREVLGLMSEGKRVGEIAKELGLSVKTVSTYKTRVTDKLGFEGQVRSADIVARACEKGFIKASDGAA